MGRASEVLGDKTEYSNPKGPFLFAPGIHSNTPTDMCLELAWELGPVFNPMGEDE